jgi:chemotaxis protein methyltransferase CheR
MPPHLSDQDFGRLTRYIHSICGLSLGREKKYLVLQRLEEMVRECADGDFARFADMLEDAPCAEKRERIIAAITTNETSFFRDTSPFDAVKNHLLPGMTAEQRKWKAEAEAQAIPRKVRIWSAGASTGQEPYSLAILILEYLEANPGTGLKVEDFQVLATDISDEALSKAVAGRYSEQDVARGLSTERLEKRFYRQGKGWAANDEVKGLVEFRKINLIESFGLYCRFDLILCRNVLIYFDESMRKSIVERLHDRLEGNGALVLGGSENLYTLTSKFRSETLEEGIVYRKKV